MKYNLNNKVKVGNNVVYLAPTIDVSSGTKTIGVMVGNKDGMLYKRFDISAKQLRTNKGTFDVFYNYGFTQDEVQKISKELNRLFGEVKFKNGCSGISIEQVHRLLTVFAEERNYMEEIDEKRYCCVPTQEFREWVREEAIGYRNHLEVLRNFEMMELLKTNQGRNDYKRKSDGERCYCVLAWEEDQVSTQEDQDGAQEEVSSNNIVEMEQAADQQADMEVA